MKKKLRKAAFFVLSDIGMISVLAWFKTPVIHGLGIIRKTCIVCGDVRHLVYNAVIHIPVGFRIVTDSHQIVQIVFLDIVHIRYLSKGCGSGGL